MTQPRYTITFRDGSISVLPPDWDEARARREFSALQADDETAHLNFGRAVLQMLPDEAPATPAELAVAA